MLDGSSLEVVVEFDRLVVGIFKVPVASGNRGRGRGMFGSLQARNPQGSADFRGDALAPAKVVYIEVLQALSQKRNSGTKDSSISQLSPRELGIDRKVG